MRQTTYLPKVTMIAALLLAMCWLSAAPAVSSGSDDQPVISLQSDITLPANIRAEDIRSANPEFRRTSRRLKAERQDVNSNASETMFHEIKHRVEGKIEVMQLRRGGVTRSQRNQLTSLRRSSGNPDIQVLFERQNSTPIFLKINDPVPGSPRSSTDSAISRRASQRFLDENRKLLKINDPDSEFRLIRERQDQGGIRHLRYQQVHHQIPVWGREISTHLDADDNVFLLSGRYFPTPSIDDTQPAITPEQARLAALNHFGITGDMQTDPEPAELVYFAPECNDKHIRLAYKLDINKSLQRAFTCFIDAHDGTFLHKISKVHTTLTSSSGRDLMGINRTFNVWSEGGYLYLIDPSTPLSKPPYSPIPNIKSYGHTYILDAQHGDDQLFFIRRDRQSGTWDAAGISAAHHTRRVHEYYLNTFGRKGIDDKYMNYLVVVHLMRNYAGAFWNGKFVVLGDGDNVVFSSLANSLDVIAHEIQHGITQFTAGLVYENQSGALNEAYSDIFACMVDRDNWTVGEDVTLRSPGFLRNLADPAHALDPLPTKMSEYRNLPNTEQGDYGGVHINMSIPSRAAYLMAEGLSKEGKGQSIGRDKTEQIFYHALVNLLKAYSQFVDARVLTIESARQLYGANPQVAAAVQMAWDEVEVYGEEAGTPESQKPSSGDIISGSDMMIYLYPVNDVHDPSNLDAKYDLYVQHLPKPFPGYDEKLDIGPLNKIPVKYSRPSAITISGETLIFYIGEDDNLYCVMADGTNHEQVTTSGEVGSFSISNDRRYVAFTSIWTNDNYIYVGDLQQNTTERYQLKPLTDKGPDMESYLNTILYADSLSFDYTGRVVVFDALNCISTENDPCSAPNGGHRYWSIGYLNVESGAIMFPFPNQNPDIDVAYPSFAYNNSNIVALDLLDYRNYYTDGEIYSSVYALNRNEQTVGHVINPNRGTENRPVYGVPSFWGDDDFITVQVLWDNNGGLARVPVMSNWSGDDDKMQYINDYAAAMPFMHRAGERNLRAEIETNPHSLNFGRVTAGESRSMTLKLANNSSRDINITNLSIPGTREFRHNGRNTLLPRNRSLDIRVTFAPTRAAGSSSAVLLIESDSSIPQTQVSLTGTSVSSDAPSDDDNGGGCFINSLKSWIFR